MIPQQQAKIQQSIALLQEVLGKASLQTQPIQQHQAPQTQATNQANPFPEFEKHLKIFQSKGKQVGGKIAQLTDAAVNMFNFTLNYVGFAKQSKKPDDPTIKKLQELLKSKADPIVALEKEDQWRDHAKSVKQMINASFWVFSPTPDLIFQGALEASEFNANRYRVHKVMPVNDWYASFLLAVKAFKKEVNEGYPSGLTYNFNGTGSWNDLLTGNVPQQTQQQAPQASQPVQTNVIKPEQKPLPAKKAPSRTNTNGNWVVANYEGQTIQFSAEQAVMRNAFFIENCSKCIIKIDKSKFKSVVINKCQNIRLIVKDCISGVQIINSKSVECTVLGTSPSISVDKSEKIHIILNGANKATDILSSKVTQLNITYTLPDGQNLAKDQAVPEQIVTRWNQKNNRFESVVYDKFM